MKKFILSIAATIIFGCGCLWTQTSAMKITADTTASRPRKAPIPLNLPLSGTVNGNQYQKGSVIESTQVIESGKTTYLAEEEIILEEGFEVMDGAEFEVLFDRDSFHIVTMMTYNLWTHSNAKYTEHAKVIKNIHADVISLQEVHGGNNNFEKLKSIENGYDGRMYVLKTGTPDYGIGMLWNKNTIGKPIDIQNHPINITDHQYDKDKKRGYIIAEFRDFCFVATHFSLDPQYQNKMADMILEDNIVQRCTTTGKPVYIAGDMNTQPEGTAIKIFKEKNFLVLNDTTKVPDRTKYVDSTMFGGAMIDLILEHNTNPYRKVIDRGIALSEANRKSGWLKKISDHFPYFVKLKVK